MVASPNPPSRKALISPHDLSGKRSLDLQGALPHLTLMLPVDSVWDSQTLFPDREPESLSFWDSQKVPHSVPPQSCAKFPLWCQKAGDDNPDANQTNEQGAVCF